jgi:rRNA maturation protein Rpf1
MKMPALLSSSRKPCARTRTLLKDLTRLLPQSAIANRGKMSVEDLAETARGAGLNRVIIVCDSHGNPGEIRFVRVEEDEWAWLARWRVRGVKLAREYDEPAMPRAAEISVDDGKVAGLFGIEPEESGFELRSQGGVLSFWRDGSEIGPRLKFEEVRDEA